MARKRTEATVEVETFRGDWFTISGPGQGDRGVELASEVQDFYDAPVSTIRNKHAFQKGSSYGGKRIEDRFPIFSVYVSGVTGDEWEELDSEWRKAWDYDQESKLWVETDSSRRWLSVSLFEEPKVDMEYDPHGELRVKATMATVAGDPFWYEEDEPKKWINPIDTTDGSISTGTLRVSNPTDQEIWLKYTVQAYPGAVYTLPDFSFGSDRKEMAVQHAARTIDLPPLLPGEHLRVDTDDSTTQVESSLDTQVYLRMQGLRFHYPIPPYTPPTDLPVAVTGAPAGVGVQVRMPRPWSRPWGLH
ncbi:phage tail protein [Rhodococcus sp. DMU2021]|nr:phage tail protein [Rhodococcus sp. DMU2021]